LAAKDYQLARFGINGQKIAAIRRRCQIRQALADNSLTGEIQVIGIDDRNRATPLIGGEEPAAVVGKCQCHGVAEFCRRCIHGASTAYSWLIARIRTD
jgi:hypothetical protein